MGSLKAQRVDLVVNHGRRPLVSEDVVRELERAILRSPGGRLLDGRRPIPLALGIVGWALYAHGVRSRAAASRQTKDGDPVLLAALAGPRFRSCLPFFGRPGRKFLYLFDAWPAAHPDIRDFAHAFGVETIFVSSAQAAQALGRQADWQTTWVPEGVEIESYRSLPAAERDIDVLQFGRRWEEYHGRIASGLRHLGLTYYHESVKGDPVFPTREAFINGLSRSKVSICFPSNLTHPQRAGGIATMTERYLQSMASRCLVIGVMPPEMRTLFEYTPIIEVDLQDPVGQLQSVLGRFEDYAELIERNYREVRERHTWDQRWASIAGVISGVRRAPYGAVEPLHLT